MALRRRLPVEVLSFCATCGVTLMARRLVTWSAVSYALSSPTVMRRPSFLTLALSIVSEARRSAVPVASVTTPATASPCRSPSWRGPCSRASPPARPPCGKVGSRDRSCSYACRSYACAHGSWPRRHHRRCRPWGGSSSVRPGFDQRPVDRKMLIRQQRFDLRMVQKLGHELGEYLAALQPVAVLREHGRVPHQVVGRKSHEPAVQKIVVQLLHQLAFRPDAVEHLQQQGAQQLLRRDRGTAFARVKPRKAKVQLAQHIAHKLPDLSQRMVRPHPRLRRNVRKQLPLIHKCAPHPRLH